MTDKTTNLRNAVAAAMHVADGGEAIAPWASLQDFSPHWYDCTLLKADAAIAVCATHFKGRFKQYARNTGKGPAYMEGLLKADKVIAILHAAMPRQKGAS